MYQLPSKFSLTLVLFSLMLMLSAPVYSTSEIINDDLLFDDTLLDEALIYPDWFKLSLGDLGDDLEEAKNNGKKSIITYFGQKRCAYCEQFIKTSLADTDIKNYLTRHYDVIAFDIWGIDDVIDTDGKIYTERELSIRYKANFTPSLIFYDAEGAPVFRLRGFYPPYKFRAALQYVTEEFYKKETFAEYLLRASPGEYFLLGGLTEREFFIPPPYDLQAARDDGKPIAVFFEQANCHTCDLLHSGALNKEESVHELEQMHVVQLNMWANTPIITPNGKKLTAKNWAKSLNLFYTPSILFFSPEGNEIIRVDSVTHFYRLWGVLDYVNQQGYKKSKNYQDWRLQRRAIKLK